MNHIISIRYNTGLYDSKRDHEEWMDYRYELFSRFTIPSIMNQTVQPVPIFVVLDARTSKEDVTKIQNLYDKIVIIRGWKTEFKNRLTSMFGHTQCIITKIDNDDMIQRSFLGETQLVAKNISSDKCIVDLNNILSIDDTLSSMQIKNMSLIRSSKIDWVSPIYSIVQTLSDNIILPLDLNHTKARKHIRQLFSIDSLGCQVIHNMNLVNAIKEPLGSLFEFKYPIRNLTKPHIDRLRRMFGF